MWIMLPIPTATRMGPSTESMKAITRELSRTPRSVVNLLVSKPVGVVSKKLLLALTKKFIMF